ncbi:MAG: hypothetical protein ACMXYB_01370 [Candidatus Woesearchaeota archaeon]
MKYLIIKSLQLLIILGILLSQIVSFSTFQQYNQNTYSFITQENINTIISTNREEVEFSFTIVNKLDAQQDFNISINPTLNWEVLVENPQITLNPHERKEIKFLVLVPQNLGYTRIVDSQGLSKFVLDDEFFGVFNFPIFINPLEDEDTLEVVYRLEVYAPMNLPVDFSIEPSTTRMSPEFENSLRVSAQNLDESKQITKVKISKQIGEVELETKELNFSYLRDVIDISFSIPEIIKPGNYDRIVRVSLEGEYGRSQQWKLRDSVEILEFERLEINENTFTNIWSIGEKIEVTNIGNTRSLHTVEREFQWYERFFFVSNTPYVRDGTNYIFQIQVEPSETSEFAYEIRYGIILVLLFIVVIISLIKVYFKYKNPLAVEIDFEHIKKVKHEGIKSFKVKVGFENIRSEEIDTLRVTFKMPSYLHVKDESFSITPPTKVLKGSNKYKLIWEFKRFEKGDTRILGFELVNSKGILGDIHFEDLEFEVISKNSTAKYYTPVDSIRG